MILLGRGSLEERWTTIDGSRIFARVSEQNQRGNLPPVVLVHGLGVSSRYMVPLASNLARSFSVYAPDLPGFGLNSKPRECSPFPLYGSLGRDDAEVFYAGEDDGAF